MKNLNILLTGLFFVLLGSFANDLNAVENINNHDEQSLFYREYSNRLSEEKILIDHLTIDEKITFFKTEQKRISEEYTALLEKTNNKVIFSTQMAIYIIIGAASAFIVSKVLKCDKKSTLKTNLFLVGASFGSILGSSRKLWSDRAYYLLNNRYKNVELALLVKEQKNLALQKELMALKASQTL